MHVIEPLPIEPADDVHDVVKYDRAMESPRLRCVSYGIDFGPLALVDVELVYIIEPLLISIDSTKNVYLTATNHS